jgi:NADH:ubiquinone oxidoreductase subunit E/NAD-dependent dihydropyrimidine dehydrogenase PreA subunit
MSSKNNSVLVVGGGIAGIQASIDLANMGMQVYLVEKSPSIGGRMAQLDKTFPTNDCAMCILAPKMIESYRHENVKLLTYSEVVGLEGQPGDFQAKVLRNPRYIDEAKCTGCEVCVQNCPVQYKIYWPPGEAAGPQIPSEDQQKVDELLNRYSYKRAPLIPVLQGINAGFNYLPAEILYYVSHRLDIPLAHILRVATFYALFSLKPRGKHVISVCQGTSCFVRGAERLMDRLHDELGIGVGEVTEDRKFSLEVVRCIGCCALAPVFKVGERVHAKVRPKEVADILKGY